MQENPQLISWLKKKIHLGMQLCVCISLCLCLRHFLNQSQHTHKHTIHRCSCSMLGKYTKQSYSQHCVMVWMLGSRWIQEWGVGICLNFTSYHWNFSTLLSHLKLCLRTQIKNLVSHAYLWFKVHHGADSVLVVNGSMIISFTDAEKLRDIQGCWPTWIICWLSETVLLLYP